MVACRSRPCGHMPITRSWSRPDKRVPRRVGCTSQAFGYWGDTASVQG